MNELALKYIEWLGGKENICEIGACITRLRLVLDDNTKINENALKLNSASGIMKAGTKATQIIVELKRNCLLTK